MKEYNIIVDDIPTAYSDTLFETKLYVPSSPRKNHILAFVKNGRLSNTQNGNTEIIGEGEILYIRNGTLDVSKAFECKRADYITVEFTTVNNDFSLPVRIRPSDSASLSEAFDFIYRCKSGTRPDWKMKSLEKLYFILNAILDEININSELCYVYKRIEPAVKYISEHFSESGVRNDFLAGICGISEASLNRLFFKAYGTTVHKHILGKRMEKAKNLLCNSANDIGEIAVKCGWQDIYSFSHAFCFCTGMSPTKWRMVR